MDASLRPNPTVHKVGPYLLSFDTRPQTFGVDDIAPPTDADSRSTNLSAPVETIEEASEQMSSEVPIEHVPERPEDPPIDIDARLAEERQRWMEEVAEELASKLADSLRHSMLELREDVAHTLSPIVARNIAERALDAFIDALKSGLSNEENPQISIFAPPEMIATMQRTLGEESIKAAFIETNHLDMRATIGRTMIETALAALLSNLPHAPEHGQ